MNEFKKAWIGFAKGNTEWEEAANEMNEVAMDMADDGKKLPQIIAELQKMARNFEKDGIKMTQAHAKRIAEDAFEYMKE
jgi:hypothetical protein